MCDNKPLTDLTICRTIESPPDGQNRTLPLQTAKFEASSWNPNDNKQRLFYDMQAYAYSYNSKDDDTFVQLNTTGYLCKNELYNEYVGKDTYFSYTCDNVHLFTMNDDGTMAKDTVYDPKDVVTVRAVCKENSTPLVYVEIKNVLEALKWVVTIRYYVV